MAPLRPWLGAGPVLELGCGNGKTLLPLLRSGVEAIGLDVSWNVLCRLEGPRALLLADAAHIPLADGVVSCVLDLHCGGHLDPAGRAALAREAWRVCRPGGHLVVERLGRDDLRAAQGAPVAGDPEARGLQDGRTTWFATPETLRVAFEAAGWNLVKPWEERRTPRLRGVPTLRSTVGAVFCRPARAD